VIGHPIEDHAADVLRELGGDPSDFAARQLSPRIASSADLVLTMSRKHRDTVLEMAPRQLHKTFTLCEAARLVIDCGAENLADLPLLRPSLAGSAVPDIPDPIGQTPEIFAQVGQQIADALWPVLQLCRDL